MRLEAAILFGALKAMAAWEQAVPNPALYRWGVAAAVTLIFTCIARWIRGVTVSGAIAGGMASCVLYASAGPGAFAALVSVFVLAMATTRLGYSQKQKLGTAEKNEGRSASQVLANLAVATVAAGLSALFNNSLWLVGCTAALAEAAADTVSSEYGQARRQWARLITTWEIVPAGVDGGISLEGTVAGSIAALILGWVCVIARLVRWKWGLLAAVAAVLGMLLDSWLGASLERRRTLNNDQVNFLSTLAAALLAVLLARVVG